MAALELTLDAPLLLLRFCAAAGDGAGLFGSGEGEGGEEFFGEFGEGEGVGGVELVAPVCGGEDFPVKGSDPVGAGEVGCGDEAFELEQFGVAGGAGSVHHECVVDEAAALKAWIAEVDDGEHLAADGLVADPEDEVLSPLHGFSDVGEGEEIGAEAFGIHD